VAERVRHLNCATRKRAPLTLADVRALAGDPSSEDLLSITAGGGGLGPEAARVIAGSAYLPGLRGLDLGSNPIGDEGLAAIVQSPLARELEWLGVSEATIGDAGVRALADAAPPALKRLYLSRNPAGPQALASLVSLPALVELHIDDTAADDACCIALVRGLVNLRILHAKRTSMTCAAHRQIKDDTREAHRVVLLYDDFSLETIRY